MSIIRFKGKVRLISEEQLEIENQYDAGNIAKDVQWGWRSVAISVEEIYKIISFARDKSLILLYDEEKILVNEPFTDLYKRWCDIVEKKDNKPEDIQKDLEKHAEEDEDKD